MKTCSHCKLPLPSAAFSKDSAKPDGLQAWCKACRRARYAANRAAEIQSALEYVANNPERAYPAKRAWNKANRRQVSAEYRRDHRLAHIKANPEKHKARRQLRRAVKSGRIVKPSVCSECQQAFEKRQIHGHHADYNKPLDVQWLCFECHGKQHRLYAVEAEAVA